MAELKISNVIDIAGNAPGGSNTVKATIDLEIGPRYRKIWLIGTVARATLAPRLGDIFDLTETVKVKVNGRIVREFTVGELDALNTLYGSAYAGEVTLSTGRALVTPAAGNTCTFRIPIFLWEDWRPGMAWREGLAWPTKWKNGYQLKSLQVEVPLQKALSTGGATSAWAFTCRVETDETLGDVNKDGTPIFNATMWERIVQPYTAAADLPISTITKQGLLQQITVFSGYYKIVSDVVTKNGNVMFEDTDAALIDNHNRKYGLNVVDQPTTLYLGGGILAADRTDMVCEQSDNPFDSYDLGGAKSFVVTPTLASASATVKTLTLLVARFGTPLMGGN